MTHLELMLEVAKRSDIDIKKVRLALGVPLVSAARDIWRKGDQIDFAGLGAMLVNKKAARTIKNNNIQNGAAITYRAKKTITLKSVRKVL